jgi:anti-sigma factor RsiW
MSEIDRPTEPSTGSAAGSAGATASPDIADAGRDEADRLIAAALADHVRIPAPRRLHEQLARRHLGPRKPWRSWTAAFALGAAAAALILLVIVPGPGPAPGAGGGDGRGGVIDGRGGVIDEAVGDYLRIVGAQHPLDVETNDLHNVKPWFTGRLDFVPPVSFIGDDEFRLRGGELAVFLGRKAAAFVYQRRLHTISVFVFTDAAVRPREETTSRGFHVITWASGGFGMALVSDVGWDDLRLLEARVRS